MMLDLDSDGEVRVYGWDKLVLLRHLLDQGLSKTAIAAQAGVSRRLIYHLLRTGQLDRDFSGPRVGRRRAVGPSRLAPYQPLIAERLATYPALSAVRLFAECRAAGYAGSYTQLRLYVKQVRPTPAPEPIVRFETPPGHQAQVDFAEERGQPTSIEDMRVAHRADALREVSAAVRFISAEPLLGSLNALNLDGIHWVIGGGESGEGFRPCDKVWAADLRDHCNAEGVAFFWKQWGGSTPKAGGRLLEGRTWDEYPVALSSDR